MNVCVASVALLLLAGAVHGQNYRAGYFAGAPGDDPNTNGELLLYVNGDSLAYRAALNNAIDVTGVHLHLQGNSSDGLFGGPLLLALTNTTAANGQAPVSSSPNQELVQQGSKNGADLTANPMRPMVAARLTALGQPGGPPNTIAELRDLIDRGLVYTDVHTLERVSPQGLTRGRVEPVSTGTPSNDDDDHDDDSNEHTDEDGHDDHPAAADDRDDHKDEHDDHPADDSNDHDDDNDKSSASARAAAQAQSTGGTANANAQAIAAAGRRLLSSA